MSLNYPSAGLNLATEFQTSGIPFVTSSIIPSGQTVRIDFHHVSKAFTVRNSSGSGSMVRIGFTKNGVEGVGGAAYFRLEGGQSEVFDIRVKQLFLRSDGAFGTRTEVLAALTNVLAGQMGELTGTYSDGTPGWSGVG